MLANTLLCIKDDPEMDIYLFVIFLAILLMVISVGIFTRAVRHSELADEFLARGTSYPYENVNSLDVKYFLPWIAPDVSTLPVIARGAFLVARISAWVAVLVLVGFFITAIANAY